MPINPDPHAAGYEYSPHRRIQAVYTTCDAVSEAVRGLAEAGFADPDVQIFVGAEGAEQLDVSGSRHSPGVRLWRGIQSTVLADGSDVQVEADRALRAGGCVIDVQTNGEEGRIAAARAALKPTRPLHLVYWGDLVVEFL